MPSYAKVYPEESFFIVPGKANNPLIRQKSAEETRKTKEELERKIKIIKNTNVPEGCCVIM